MAAKFEDRQGRGANAPAQGREPVIGATPADTLPPMPLKGLLSAGGANLYVLSTDAELIDTAQRAGGEQYPVFAVSTWDELEAAVITRQCGIALLDTALLGSELEARIESLGVYSSRLVTLVAADRAVSQQLMGLLSERKIHRLLIKPPALGITRLLIESAVNRCLQLRELASSADDALVSPRVRKKPQHAGVPLWVLLSAGAALLAGVAMIVAVSAWWRAAPEPVDVVAPTQSAPAPAVAPLPAEEPASPFAELLAQAEGAFREGRLAAPPGDNALDYSLAVLAADPAEPAARAQLDLVIEALFTQAEEALLNGAYDTADAALAHVRRAEPTSGRLAFLAAQLERSRAAAAAARPAVAAAPVVEPERPSDSPPDELASLLTIANARIERGQLLEPAGDSAREYLERAAQLAPEDAGVQTVRSALAAKLVAAARLALESADVDAAEGLTTAAQQLGAEPEGLALVDAELAVARTARAAQMHADWLASADARLRAGALVEPTEDNALYYLGRLESEAPDLAGLEARWSSFRERVGGEATTALAAHEWSAAETWLAVLERAPRGAAAAAPLRADLEAGRLQERYLATASPASELTVVERAPLVYPEDAERRGIEGWVDVEFVVDVTGRTKDLTVVAAEPEGRFEEAALTAIRQYRYAPFEQGGRLFERRVRQRIRFALQ